MLTHWEMITRIAVAAILGGTIGFERDRHGRHAGLRTHLIVAMAAGTFMVISTHFPYYQNYSRPDLFPVDTSRIAAAVVSGIGFLAGGAILKTGLTIQGLTTAAGLWLVTAIGLCAGGGMYVESVAVTIMGLIALTVVRRFEDKQDGVITRHVFMEFSEDEDVVDILMQNLKEMKVTMTDFNYERKITDGVMRIEFTAHFPEAMGNETFIRILEQIEGLKKIQVG